MTDTRTLRRNALDQGLAQIIGSNVPDWAIKEAVAATAAIKPGYAIKSSSNTQVTESTKGDIFLGVALEDLSGYTACKTIGGTYTTGDPVKYAIAGEVNVILVTAQGDPLAAGAALEVSTVKGLFQARAQATNSTVYGPHLILMESAATADATQFVKARFP